MIEGVTKFSCTFSPAPPLQLETLAGLVGWRQTLYREGLIGQDTARYDGAAFGNVSMRLPPFSAAFGRRKFAITGTQTGGMESLTERNFVVIDSYVPQLNVVVAHGPVKPSSESMTHGAVYDAYDKARFAFHVHSPDIWRAAAKLGIPSTRPDVPYGTPAMAAEISRLLRESGIREKKILSMGGHEDGIISFGSTADEAGKIILDYLEKSRA